MNKKTIIVIVFFVILILILADLSNKSNNSLIKKLVSRGGIRLPAGGFFGGDPSTGTPEEYVDFSVYSKDPIVNPGTAEVTLIDWGTLYPGGSAYKDVYITNHSNPTKILNFTVETANWEPPEFEEYMTLTLSYPNNFVSPLEPNATLLVRLRLQSTPNVEEVVNSTKTTYFTFDLIITAYI